MKFALLVSVFISIAAFADAKDLSKYPLRIHIVQQQWRTTSYRLVSGVALGSDNNGSGHGNIEDGDSWQGFDYTLKCDRLPDSTTIELTFMGKWKKPETRLIILVPEVGKPQNVKECELQTTLKNVVYGIERSQQFGDHLVTYKIQQYPKILEARKKLEQDFHPTDVDIQHFPLSVPILDAQWQDSGAMGAAAGTGRGDILSGSAIMAFDFEAICPARLMVSLQGSGYQGRWQQDQKILVVLTHDIGNPQSFRQCELSTTVHPDRVYTRNTAGIVGALTQEQYKSLSNAKSTQVQNPSGAGAIGPSATPTATLPSKPASALSPPVPSEQNSPPDGPVALNQLTAMRNNYAMWSKLRPGIDQSSLEKAYTNTRNELCQEFPSLSIPLIDGTEKSCK